MTDKLITRDIWTDTHTHTHTQEEHHVNMRAETYKPNNAKDGQPPT